MASNFSIGKPTVLTEVLLSPFSQQWLRVPIGIDFQQNTVYSGNEEIRLQFDSSSMTFAREWVEAASGGSLNITVLSRFGANTGGGSWTDLSGVTMTVEAYPTIEAAHSGPFTILVRGASAI